MTRPRRSRSYRQKLYRWTPSVFHPFQDSVLAVWDRWRALSWQRKTVAISMVVIGVAVVIPLLSYAYYARDISDKERLLNRNNTGVVLLDRNGKEFFSYNNGREQGELTSLDDISDYAEQALIAAEDQDFYEHSGFSFRSIVAAAYANISGGDLKRYGGSTITQQLVKNSILSSEKTFFRKYQELFLSIAIDRQYSKDEVLEMYLNSVYFGEGAFGIESAAQTYFSKSAAQLTLEESSALIGLLPGPSIFNPVSGDPVKTKEKQAVVLERMVDNSFITQTEADSAKQAPIKLDYQPQSSDNEAYHFALEVIDRLEERYGEERILRSGYVVTTTLDIEKQRQAEAAVSSQVARLAYANATNGAAVAIDPSSGEVLVMVGSYDYTDENFGAVNMALTPRQPGSSFKPVFYSESLARNVVTPATIIRDEPTVFSDGYEPQNYDFRFRGDIRVRDALATSLNIPAVKVLDELGLENGINAAQRLGLDTIEDDSDYGLAFALGVAEVPLLDLTNVYATFANQGDQYNPITVRSIDNKYGRTIYKSSQYSRSVISESAAFQISSILSDEAARAPTFGSRFSIGRTMAVKTGTTQDSRDAWTMAYTPSLALGVWVGNNDNTPMQGLGGSSAAGPISVELMQSFLNGQPNEDFTQPPDIIAVQVCPGEFKVASGSVPGAYTEYFVSGTLPAQKCYPPQPEPEPEPEPVLIPEEDDDDSDDDFDLEDPTDDPSDDEGPTDPVDDPIDGDPIVPDENLNPGTGGN